MKFISFLLALETLWLILFTALVISAFVLTPKNDDGANMRSDIFSLRTHVLVAATIVAIARGRSLWLFPLFVYLIFVDVANLLEISLYSPLRQLEGLWGYGVAVVSYQLLTTFLVFFWFLSRLAARKKPGIMP